MSFSYGRKIVPSKSMDANLFLRSMESRGAQKSRVKVMSSFFEKSSCVDPGTCQSSVFQVMKQSRRTSGDYDARTRVVDTSLLRLPRDRYVNPRPRRRRRRHALSGGDCQQFTRAGMTRSTGGNVQFLPVSFFFFFFCCGLPFCSAEREPSGSTLPPPSPPHPTPPGI